MDTKLWAIFLITAICIGYLVGYSIPPMIEAGLIGGGWQDSTAVANGQDTEQQAGAAEQDGQTEAELLEYYRSLQQIDSQ